MTETYEFPNPTTAWLVCLFFVLSKTRREGLQSIEGDLDALNTQESMFRDFPQTLQAPYLEFATDVLRMAVAGNMNAEDLSVYAEHAIAGHAVAGGADMQLLKTIWLTLWASLSGYAPHHAVEFGRQAVPVAIKPTHAALEAEYRGLSQRGYKGTGWRRVQAAVDASVDEFMDSLSDEGT